MSLENKMLSVAGQVSRPFSAISFSICLGCQPSPHFTVSVVHMPAMKWPGMLQYSTYAPGFSSS
jgi:hypothetical protein